MGVIGDPDNYFTGGVSGATGNSLRIDRMLAEGVRGALDLIKTALPGDISPNRTSPSSTGDPAFPGGSYRGNGNQQSQHLPPNTRSCVELKYDNDASGRRLRQAVLNYIDRLVLVMTYITHAYDN